MPVDFISLRKDQLLHQISEARKIENQDQLFWLRSQWVHRYGINTLHETEEYEKTQSNNEVLPQVKSSGEISIEGFETKTFEISTAIKKDETIENKKFISDDLISTNEDKLEELPDLAKKVILEKETKRDSKVSKHVVFQSPPIPSINQYRKWLTSLDNELPKAS